MTKPFDAYPDALAEALRRQGLEPTKLPTIPDLEGFDLQDLIDDAEVELRDDLYEDYASAFLEIGQPGTRIINGKVSTEPNPMMRPALARGSYGSYGVFDDLMREDGAHKSITTLSNLIATGDFKLVWGDNAKAHDAFAIYERAAQDLLARFKAAEWDQFIDDACSAIHKGFAIFEVSYSADSRGRLYPERFGFREQSTVSKWILDPYGRELIAVQFDTMYQDGTAAKHNYTLPVWNRNGSPRVMLCNIGMVGNNFEGMTPLRTLVVLIDLKKLLLSIAGASNERFGCPILASKHHDATLTQDRAAASEAAVTGFSVVLQTLQALDTPTVNIPRGLDLLYLSPQGDAADVVPMLNYIDARIAGAFATQAQQLGHAGVGSYALSKVQDNDLLRAAPAYARSILKGVNRVYHHLLVHDYNVPKFLVPSIGWTAQESIDVSRWLQDVERLAQVAPSLPRSVRRAACEHLGLSPDAFEDMER